MAMDVTTNTQSLSTPVLQNNATQLPTKTIAGKGDPVFQPETQVDVNGTTKNLLESLQKTVLKNTESLQEMPKEIQKLINNIMKGSFALEESISQGISSTLQGQRVSVEQLNILSKVIEQLSLNNSSNEPLALSDTLKTVLSNLKLLDGQGGKLLDVTSLNKIALQLLDGKPVEELPEAVQNILTKSENTNVQSAGTSSSMQFLKQLIKQFMPEVSSSTVVNQQITGKNQSIGQSTILNNQAANLTGNNTNLVNSNSNSMTGTTLANQNIVNNTNQTGELPQNVNNQSGQAVSQQSVQGQVNTNTANNTLGRSQNIMQNVQQQPNENNGAAVVNNNAANQAAGQMQKLNNHAGQSINQQNSQGQNNPGNNAAANLQSSSNDMAQNTRVQINNTTGQTAQMNSGQKMNVLPKQQPGLQENIAAAVRDSIRNNPRNANNTAVLNNTLHTVPLKNDLQTMLTLKNLAQQVIRQNQNGTLLNKGDAMVLRSFANSTQTALSNEDSQTMQKLLQTSQQNVPLAIKQAAVKNNLPDLPKLWALVNSADMTELNNIDMSRLRSTSKDISTFVTMLKHSVEGDVQTQNADKTMAFMTPIYFGEQEKPYPAYIHIYHQEKQEQQSMNTPTETWLRICMLTENIGAVELVFRMYERSRMDLRVAFSDDDTATSFTEQMQEIRQSFREMKLQLADVKVSVV